MKTKLLIVLSLIAVAIFSCDDEEMEKGVVIVQNKVHNARLENINFGDYGVAYSLLPGQSSDEKIIQDYKEFFPKMDQIEFLMVRNGNTVYLKTSESYQLNSGDTLTIVIGDDTEVYNPVTE